MLRFLMIIVTVFSFVAVSFTVQAHETRMGSAAGYSAHSQHIQNVSSWKNSCDGDKTCKADIGLCYFVCAGVSVLLPLDRISANEASRQEKYVRSPNESRPATAPELNYRPPILRLL